jgi:hypothetical protein
MATSVTCDICEEGEAILLCGNTQTGEQTAFCSPCWARTGIKLGLGLLDPDEILDLLGIAGGQVGQADGSAAPPSPPNGKPGRPRKAGPAPEVVD